MPTYRPPRPGDLITVRSTDPHLDEVQVVIDTITDNGGYILLSGAWGGKALEVLITRVGSPTLNPMEK